MEGFRKEPTTGKTKEVMSLMLTHTLDSREDHTTMELTGHSARLQTVCISILSSLS